MPHVINGIGTWYHGRRNRIKRHAKCEQCNRVADLESYDTTLFFVVVFIPIIPLARKHIRDDCSLCRRHWVMKLSEWETQRSDQIAQALRACNASPADEALAVRALAVAATFDSGETMDVLEHFVAAHHMGSAPVQRELGHSLEHMNRHERATDALLRAHELAPTDASAEELAVQMFRHGEPKDALPLIDHVFEQRRQEGRGLAYLGVEALQARGQHEEALGLLDRIAQTFPGSEQLKDHKRYDKASRRRLGTSKRVKSNLAQLGRKDAEGTTGGGWAGRWPWLVGPALALVFAVLFVRTGLARGRSRDVWLVNGLGRGYTVMLAGREVLVYPGAAMKVQVPMGEVSWEVKGEGVTVPAGRVTISENFFARPFSGRVFVINPDGNAVLLEEHHTYSSNGQTSSPDDGRTAHCCSTLHEFSGMDYVFRPFPQTVEASSVIRKSGVSVYSGGTLAQVGIVYSTAGAEAARAEVTRWIAADPRTEEVYQPALKLLTSDAFEAAVAPVLAMRPPVIEAHRAHQQCIEAEDPGRDLVSDYRQVLAEDASDPARMYLLARLTHDGVEAARLLDDAIATTDPAPPVQAYMARSWARRGQGRPAEALADAKKAMEMSPDNPSVSQCFREALIASGDIDGLLMHPAMSAPYEDMGLAEVADKVYAYAAKGDAGSAAAVVAQACDAWELPQDDPLRAALLAQGAAVAEDWQEYARLAASPYERFIVALRAGDFGDAERFAAECDSGPGEWRVTLTLALAGAEAGRADVVASAIGAATQAMAKGRWEDRQLGEWLGASSPPEPEAFRMVPVDVESKCLVAAALGAKFPAARAQYFGLARSLNYDRRPPYHVVQALVGRSW